jgi:acetyl-CoA carboxylase biotin carboxyl carrier protein
LSELINKTVWEKSVDLKFVQEFIDIAKKSGVAELELKNGEQKLLVKMAVAGHIVSAPVHAPIAQTGSAAETPKTSTKGLLEVTSPFVGTFYRSSSPDKDSYVKQGDRVSSGKVLCIVEAMKIMNEIESDVAGEIVEICVENETYVEFGQVLFRIKP